MNARQIEIAVARHYCYRRNVIVPNVSWGLGLHYEADLVVLRPSGWAEEIEIKISKSDIKADLKKSRAHECRWFRRLWFAVPVVLADSPDIPERAGILSVDDELRVKVVRPAKIVKHAERMPEHKQKKLLHLASMRVWTLKEKLMENQVNKRTIENRE